MTQAFQLAISRLPEIIEKNSRGMMTRMIARMNQLRTPKGLGGSPVTLHLDLVDVDPVFERAVKAGATVTMPLADQFWGDRYGQLRDPFGHQWSLATHVRDATREEIQEAMKKMCA